MRKGFEMVDEITVIPAKAGFAVIPAKAGIQVFENQNLGSRLRGNDEVGALA